MSQTDKLAALEAAIDRKLDQLTESITTTEKRIAEQKRHPAGPPPDRLLSTLTRAERVSHLQRVQAHAASLPPAEARAAVAKFKRLREEHKALSAEEQATLDAANAEIEARREAAKLDQGKADFRDALDNMIDSALRPSPTDGPRDLFEIEPTVEQKIAHNRRMTEEWLDQQIAAGLADNGDGDEHIRRAVVADLEASQ